MQPPAPKLSKVHLNILNLKNMNKANFLCIFWNLLCISYMIWTFGPDADQIKGNFGNLLFIYVVKTSTHKMNKICIFNLFDGLSIIAFENEYFPLHSPDFRYAKLNLSLKTITCICMLLYWSEHSGCAALRRSTRSIVTTIRGRSYIA